MHVRTGFDSRSLYSILICENGNSWSLTPIDMPATNKEAKPFQIFVKNSEYAEDVKTLGNDWYTIKINFLQSYILIGTQLNWIH